MRTVLIVIVCTILSIAGTLLFIGKDGGASAHETAYERIMRTGTIRCAYALWPPFLDRDPNTGKLSGFNYDIWTAIGRELGLKVEWVEEVGFGNYIEGLKTGRYDAMCQTVWPDPGRFKNALVTLPAHYHKVHVVVRADDRRFDQGWAKLNSPEFKAAVIDGDITDSIAQTDFPLMKRDSLPQATDARQMFTEIETGKADATFVDYGFFKDYDSKNPGKLKIAGSVLHVYGSVFSLPPGEIALKSLVDSVMLKLTNSGDIATILSHYVTTAMPPAPTYVGKAE